MPRTRVTGIDACPGGWVAVTLASGGPPAVRVAPTLDALDIGGPAGIDMPLGLLAHGWRTADALARRVQKACPERRNKPGHAQADGSRAVTGAT